MQRLLLILSLFLSSLASAQEVHRLSGYIQMPGEELVSYFVQFTVKDTKVTGYTITDYTGGNRLRASLIGRLSPASELYIEENGSLDGPDARFSSYCYFKARLKLSVANGRQRWSGQFESHEMNGRPCGKGYMTIIDEAPVLTEFAAPKVTPRNISAPVVVRVPRDSVKRAPPPPKDTPKALAPAVKPPPKPVVIIRAPQPREIEIPAVKDSNACMKSYAWESDTLSFDLWDGWTIDGDVISMSVNGKMILDHARLNETKKHFVIPLTPGKNTMTLYMHDEGFDPPNTPNLILFDGAVRHELAVSGIAGEKVRICFNRPQ